MVYVISKNGQPLMPTENHAKVRVLLKNSKLSKVKIVRETKKLFNRKEDGYGICRRLLTVVFAYSSPPMQVLWVGYPT